MKKKEFHLFAGVDGAGKSTLYNLNINWRDYKINRGLENIKISEKIVKLGWWKYGL